MCNPNPVAALADDIASHVRDRERDLIERLAAALGDLREANSSRDINAAMKHADAVLADADAWLAEPPVRIEVDATHGTVK